MAEGGRECELRRVPDLVGETLPGVLAHIDQSWLRRDRPDTLLVHYADLVSDLEGQMRRIAAHLRITVAADVWPGLVQAATLDRMRNEADGMWRGCAIWRRNGLVVPIDVGKLTAMALATTGRSLVTRSVSDW